MNSTIFLIFTSELQHLNKLKFILEMVFSLSNIPKYTKIEEEEEEKQDGA